MWKENPSTLNGRHQRETKKTQRKETENVIIFVSLADVLSKFHTILCKPIYVLKYCLTNSQIQGINMNKYCMTCMKLYNVQIIEDEQTNPCVV